MESVFILFMEWIFIILAVVILNQYIYDRYVQRHSALLFNYPVIARMRYFLEAIREPFRQYFGAELFYESRDKIEWVYKAAKNRSTFLSFSVTQPFNDDRFIIKHSNTVLNNDEVNENMSVTFGEKHKKPFVSKSVVKRSGMSDGALSPESTRAFAMGAQHGNFPINTGEGGLTSNYFFSHRVDEKYEKCYDIIDGGDLEKKIYLIIRKLFNGAIAARYYRKMVLKGKVKDTYILDLKKLYFFRVNWNAPIETFPTEVPDDMPDIILQIGSGLYGVRDEEHNFDPERYKKVMRFAKMTEIKIAQGAKQTGGKIIGSKVTEDIAYYRGVEAGKDLISPNRFPYASTRDELFDFIGKLQELSEKPVGMKIVISDASDVEDLAELIKSRKDNNLAIPDFITVDGGDGGSATAPLELMESVGLNAINALFILDTLLAKYKVRDELKLIASSKFLTPDDVAIGLCMGADMIAIGRAFMMSGGCIRARHCSGVNGKCPVGMATQDRKKRLSYMVFKKAEHIKFYHENLMKGLRTVMAVMGVANVSDLSKKNIAFKSKSGEILFDIDKHFHKKLHV